MNDWYECNQCLTLKNEHHVMVKKLHPDFPNNDFWLCLTCGNWELHEIGYRPHYFLPRQISRVEVSLISQEKTEKESCQKK